MKISKAVSAPETKTILILLGCIAFSFMGANVLIGQSLTSAGDPPLYFKYSSDILSGSIPYIGFQSVYPPIALLYFTLPRVLFSNFDQYVYALGWINLLVLFAISLVLFYLAKTLSKNSADTSIAFFLLFMPLLPLSLVRFDLLPVMLTLLAVYLFLTKHEITPWVVLGIAAMAKTYPIVLLPIFLIATLKNKSPKHAIKGLLAFAIAVFLIALPFLLLSPIEFLQSFMLHAERGIQIESTYSSIILAAKPIFNYPVSLVANYNAAELVFPYSDVVSFLSPILLAVILLLIYIQFYATYDGSRKKEDVLLRYTLLPILAFLVFYKVLSSQFLLWAIPFVPLVAIGSKKNTSLFHKIMIITVFLTFLVYPIGWDALLEFSYAAIVILFIRNLLLFISFYLLIR